ncbi:MAG: phosphoglycerate kinase [Candidatus Nanoarchaeia archaeon]|nr:phosphoglycerate kinase [Candidatus Nanoarchaeia archaeon]
MEFISKANVKNKIILLREDLNSEVVNGKVLMSERIKQGAETIKLLENKGAKVVVIAHQGRKGEKDFTSLKQHAKLLNRFVKIKFVDDIIGKRAENAINNLKNGEAILLDNIRSLNDEFRLRGDNKFVSKLSKLCDVYVNDAFSVCHREQASVTLFPKYMKSYAGPLLEREINALKKVNLKNCLYILAGAKPEDNMMLLNKNKVLACGLFGQMCLIAKGKNLGSQNKYLEKNISDFDSSLKELKAKLNKMGRLVETPADFAVKINGKRKELLLEEFPSKYEIYDIGKKTQEKFVSEIKRAKSIYMKGPAGFYSDKKFFKGTLAILRAISKSRAFSVLGGGQLSDAVAKSGIPAKKFGYISLSGGALLQYLAGKRLPGLEALGFYRK